MKDPKKPDKVVLDRVYGHLDRTAGQAAAAAMTNLMTI